MTSAPTTRGPRTNRSETVVRVPSPARPATARGLGINHNETVIRRA